jgi:hypothetical protein
MLTPFIDPTSPKETGVALFMSMKIHHALNHLLCYESAGCTLITFGSAFNPEFLTS